MKKIETSKGEFEIIEINRKFPKINKWYFDNYKMIKISEITEEQAIEIIEATLMDF